ncbi:TTL-like protein, partial [Mya arenaria]
MEQYGFIRRDTGSSVYKAASRYLLEARKHDWKKLPANTSSFHLMFGERNKLPFGRLGHDPGRKNLVNYYRGSDILCRKTALVKVFKEYCSLVKYSYPKWLPQSFRILPKNIKQTSIRNSSTTLMKEKPDDRDELLATNVSLTQEEGSSDGIKISDDVHTLLEYVDQQEKAFVIQRYIRNPLLLQGKRKFDISHLTNHCLQKDMSENFGRFEDGNEMFFEEFN